MAILRSILAVVALVSVVGCQGPAAAPEGGWREGTTLDGTLQVKWRAGASAALLNEMLSIDLELAEAGVPVEEAELFVTAFMPDHGHGMNYVPQTTELGGGRYRAEGVLFHMPGFWQLHVDVVRDGIATRATFDLDL